MLDGKRWSAAVVGGLFVLSLLWLVFAKLGEAADLARGEKIYGMICLACHGKEGKGDGPAAKVLGNKPANFTEPGFFDQRPDAELKKAVIDGKSPMPAFGEKLKGKDIDGVIAYIKTFNGKVARK
ncbi:MAG: c-type cytochrome [Candidatus Methylomirabilales bacterium]